MTAVNPIAQLIADDGASNVDFLQSGASAVARSVENKLRDVISIKDFGAVGDGVTDDAPALNAAIAALSGSEKGGTIMFPAGEYLIASPIVIEPVSGRDFVANLHWQGAGGHHTYMATRLWLGGNASNAGVTLKSAVQMTFSDMEFVGTAGSLAAVNVTTAGAIPYYSSFNIAFRNCRFTVTNPVKGMVWVQNCSNVDFEQCFWNSFATGTGAQTVVQVGSNSSDPSNSGTFGGGTADQIRFIQCFFPGDVKIHRCRGISFNSCVFDADPATGAGGRIYASGDQLVRGMRVDNCWAGYGDGTGTWLTMGTSGYDLTMTNTYVATYAKGVLLNGVGVANIEGNEFALNVVGAIAVHISPATFYGASVQNNHYAGMNANSLFVRDDRSSPASPTAIAPVEVNQNLAVDATADMTGYATVLSQSIKLTGGLYRIQAMITIANGVTASVFRARVNLASQTPRVAGSIYIPANQTATLTIIHDVYMEGVSTATTASLEVHQITSGTAATIKATDTNNTTMFQMTRASG